MTVYSWVGIQTQARQLRASVRNPWLFCLDVNGTFHFFLFVFNCADMTEEQRRAITGEWPLNIVHVDRCDDRIHVFSNSVNIKERSPSGLSTQGSIQTK